MCVLIFPCFMFIPGLYFVKKKVIKKCDNNTMAHLERNSLSNFRSVQGAFSVQNLLAHKNVKRPPVCSYFPSLIISKVCVEIAKWSTVLSYFHTHVP